MSYSLMNKPRKINLYIILLGIAAIFFLSSCTKTMMKVIKQEPPPCTTTACRGT